MNVYVAAPFQDSAMVLMIHERLRAFGAVPTSRWAESAAVVEDFARFTPQELRDLATKNDVDLSEADALFVLARTGAGGEMFAKARVALEWNKPVVWFGRRTLSAWRSGVVRVDGIEEGLAVLETMKHAHADGARGHLLAHLARVT